MVKALASGRHPAAPRRYIRQTIQCRARVLTRVKKDWHRGTILEISAGGCYMVTYDTIARDTQLEIEVRDIGDTYAHLKDGWFGPEIGRNQHSFGVGIAFDEATVPEALKDFLGTSFTGEG